ncbi:Putative O-methyltransferase domain, S-adenosyl-L-methionine-dependent methyltransferase superfamily [Colletotrichum destructivum]|uniref:O-methyltransferase domain, S-adenosyl-L-methionine-dependent methyltransferase superfamily n=1 Tax=Colletotrichum destructivum TaxID=34406 RepID=A0AAX4I1R8_9PEZI|nr:Putative O-methyltransferase domain, S-adenosyl-L-methionine-dependent methyltransferase superfamily [Colletotrichum destructivum]
MATTNGAGPKDSLHDASLFMTQLLVQQQQYYCLQFLDHFRILDAVPLNPRSAPYDIVAAQTGVPEPRLRAVARMVMTTGFLAETPDGSSLHHSALSATFVENEHMRIQLRHLVEKTVPLMGAFTRATELWGDTKAPNQTAYNLAFETSLPFFEHLKSRPDLSDEFDSYMKSQAVAHSGARVDHVLHGFDWAALKAEAVVVDIGGGAGAAAKTLATAHPDLRVVVQDLAGPIRNAREQLALLPQEIAARISLQQHDIVDAQLVRGADVYFLRTIIHDWPDAESITILRRLVAAMKPESRIVIMDMVLPAPGAGSSLFEAALRQKDLAMTQTFNAREREVSEWEGLITAVDDRVAILEIRRPEGSQHSVIEVGFRKSG